MSFSVRLLSKCLNVNERHAAGKRIANEHQTVMHVR